MLPVQSRMPVEQDPRAYRYFPSGMSGSEMRRNNSNQRPTEWESVQMKSEPGKKGTRFFFWGQITHDEYELKKLEEFHEYVAKNKINYDREFWTERRVLLLLQGNKYKPDKTLDSMNLHLNFKKNYLPIPLDKCVDHFKRGLVYPCGRDKLFRPIVVLNLKLVDFNALESIYMAVVYLQQLLIQKMFIPGQVQSWIYLYDLGNMGLSDLPINALREISDRLSLNYGGRLNKLIALNAPSAIWFTWKLFSAFLDPVTSAKVTIAKSNSDKMLYDIADPSQFQVKYGGTQPDRTEFWPFWIPPGVFDEPRLVSGDQYRRMHKQGKLSKNKVDPEVLNQSKPKVDSSAPTESQPEAPPTA